NATTSNNPNDIWANASGLISLDGLGKTKTKEAAPSMNALAANSWNSGAWANNNNKPSTPMGGNQGFGAFASNTNTTGNTNNANKKNNDFGDLLF
ncbi:hypothetical protein BGZ74_002980, partial [Mortierella antarctica]